MKLKKSEQIIIANRKFISVFFIAIGIILSLIGCQQKEVKQSNENQISDAEQLPNIVIIVADDLGYNDLSCYRNQNAVQSENAPTSRTPFIDNLAKNGMYFTDFYSGAAVCSPSRSALLTGRNKTRLGIYNWIPSDSPMHLEAQETTIAEVLKQKKYSTGHFGKWHLTSENMGQPVPIDQGFDYAFWTHNNAKPSHRNPINFIRNKDKIGPLEGYSCQLVVEEATKWLDGLQDKESPFYINLWFHEPHSTEAAPDSLKNRHKRNKAYYGCIENMDYAVGDFIKFLSEKKLLENTIILFTSDNGSHYLGSNDPLRGEKCFQYEGGIRVPFIAYWKDKIRKGTMSKNIGHFTDVLPTIASITNAKVSPDRKIDGIDLSPALLEGNRAEERKTPIFFYRYFHDPICMLRNNEMVLLGYQNKPKTWKIDYMERDEALFKPEEGEPTWSQWSFQKSHMQALLLQKPMYFELYNVREDPGQHNDISSKHPELLERMKESMYKQKQEMVNDGGNWFKEE